MKLIIGNQTFSSWSLRPWLWMKVAGLEFDVEKINFFAQDWSITRSSTSPTRMVPVLHDGPLVIWDSLAILEYLAERFPEKHPWPAECARRAEARAICAEMHSGFTAMRAELPMNCRDQIPSGRQFSDQALENIERVQSIWESCRRRFSADGPFLFGAFTIADAFYAPVTSRFKTYGVKMSPACAEYVAAIHGLPAMQAWIEAAAKEKEKLPQP